MKKKNGFTLIELLVVIAVIVVLMSIMLPSLGNARRIAKTTVCGTRLNQMAKAMHTFADENNRAILGNVYSSASFLVTNNGSMTVPNMAYNANNCPNICQSWDWMSPMAKQMGIPFNAGPTWADRQQRFLQLVGNKAFVCPENDILAGSFGPALPVHQMLSYNTSLLFQTRNGPGATGGSDFFSFQNYINTGSYTPKIDVVGAPFRKIFIADGARWSDGATVPTDSLYYLTTGSPGGVFADYGPWSGYTRAFNREAAPGNTLAPAGGADYRPYAFRHGYRGKFGPGNAYKINVAFFDGHVETMGDLNASDPELWAPEGATVPISEAAGLKDVQTKYFHNQPTMTVH